MFSWLFPSKARTGDTPSNTDQSESDAETSALIEAIHRSQAVIEFEPDGTILTANDNFLDVMGYDLEEIVGKHHRIFVEDEYAQSEEYQTFWNALGVGEYRADRLKRVAKDGSDVWLQATYNPVFDKSGGVRKVVKIADDVTEQVRTKRAVERREERLSSHVDALLDAMGRFVDGDLSVQVDPNVEGEIGRLFEGFNEAVRTIRETIRQVREAVSTAGATAEQVSTSAEQLSAGAEEQSSQAEEVAAAMEEMTRTISDNSESVTKTNDLARENRKTARENGQVIIQAVDKMEEIADAVGQSADQIKRLHAASEEIGDIVETIDEIAGQTNLLALNAAIEAARAGEAGQNGQAGQGFAVVAEEVRELAGRADEATDEIADMIDDIQAQTQDAVEAMKAGEEEVSVGIDLAKEAREAFEEIVEGTETMSQRIEEIAAATEEQATTSEQVSGNVQSISTVSQQNARATHDIAESIRELKQASSRAQTHVEQFHLDGSNETEDGSEREPPSEEGSGRRCAAAGGGARTETVRPVGTGSAS